MTRSPVTAIALALFIVGGFQTLACCQTQMIELTEFFDMVERKEIDHSRMPHTYFESKEQFLDVLVDGIRVLDDGKERDRCLNYLVGRYSTESRGILKNLARDASEELDIRLTATHVLALYQDIELLPFFKSLLDAPDVGLRIAGLGGIGLLMEKDTSRFRYFSFGRPTRSKLWVRSALNQGAQRIRTDEPWADKLKSRLTDDSELRRELIHRMGHAETTAERQAAARAIVNWNDDAPGLRVAEWGVWIGDAENNLQLVKSVVDEIPDFVFRTPNLVDELKDTRLNQIMTITKPVLHFTTDAPLAIDLSVAIIGGQTWFSCPKPSDFHIATRVTSTRGEPGLQSIKLSPRESFLTGETDASEYWSRFDRFSVEDIQPPYSWFKVDTMFGDTSGGMGSIGNAITGIGFSWFNLQISPDRLTKWQAPVPVKEKFKWWSELRTVNSSWINNGQQTERFLYYDGPTVSKSPVTVVKKEDTLSVAWHREQDNRSRWQTSPFGDPCQALLLQVKDGRFRSLLRLGEKQVKFNPHESEWMEEHETIDALYKMLTSRGGLTNDEASGLVQAWKKQFLETNGSRLLARINQALYNKLCPINIRPVPGELSRVGLVLFELEEFGPDWNPDIRDADAKPVTGRTDRVAEDKVIRTDSKVRAVLRRAVLQRRLVSAPDRFELLQRLGLKNDPEALRILFGYLVGGRAFYKLAKSPEFHNELQELSGNPHLRIELIDSFVNFRRSWPTASDYARVDRLLDISGHLVEEGVKLPAETAQDLAILIATREKYGHGVGTHQFTSLCAEIEPKISSLPKESAEHQQLLSVIERTIKGELECIANDSGIKARLLSPSGASHLLQKALVQAGTLAKRTPVDDRRIAKPLLIATWIAAYVHQDDVERLTSMTNDVQKNVGDRPRHINRFCNEIKDHLSHVDKKE